jgi:hypothetical protein
MKISIFSKKWQYRPTPSDYIALAALVITAIGTINGLIKYDKARIEYETLPIYPANNGTYLIRIIVKNNGDKPVTVERLSKNDDDNWLTGYNKKGESFQINKRAASLLYLNKNLNSKYQFDSKFDSTQYFDSGEGLYLDKVISPGHNLQLNIVVENTHLSDDIVSINFDGTLVLSDRTEVPLLFEVDLYR